MARASGHRSSVAALVALSVGAAAACEALAQQAFPYGRELLMDAAPLEGSKKIPILDIADDGLADIELWCDAVKARLIVVADTVTVLVGPRTTRECAPKRARADEELIGALSRATNWRIEGDLLAFTGGPKPVRFRLQTN